MRGGQLLSVKGLVNGELLELASHSLQCFKPFQRNLRGPRDELDKGSFFLFVKIVQNLPEVSDDLGVLGISVVFGVVFQILHYIRELQSMSGRPDTMSSSSLLLKIEMMLLGMISWKPSKKAFNCDSMSLPILTWQICFTYSFLFSSVTEIFCPLGIRSLVTT